ncbi:MAG: hypothetical protein ACRD32_02140 [Nitrososphaerales archaeon]
MENIADNTNACSSYKSQELLEASKLLNVLSKLDALIILSMAIHGIEADTSTCSKVGLTKKQYYTRLMQLKKVGLIEKKGKFYFQTIMGSFLYQNCINAVIHVIKNSKQMAMLDVLEKQGNLSDEELLKMKDILCSLPNLPKELPIDY